MKEPCNIKVHQPLKARNSRKPTLWSSLLKKKEINTDISYLASLENGMAASDSNKTCRDIYVVFGPIYSIDFTNSYPPQNIMTYTRGVV